MKISKKLAALLIAAALMMTLSASVFAAGEDTGFTDVDANAWYAEAVAYCREHGLMNGTSDTTFDPEGNLTRAMLVTVLYRMSGSPAVSGDDGFTDTTAGAWYADAVLWASQQGVVNGYGNGLFGTNDPVTREQMTTILWRYDGCRTADGPSDYTDRASISDYAVSAVYWAGVNNIVAPVSEGVFAPKSNATRAQVAAALMNYDRSKQSEPSDTPTGGKVLVAYFSATNTTKGIAEKIADGLGADIADLYEITPAVPYTSEDLNYSNSSSRTTLEMNDAASRPEISGSVEHMEDYDIVFLGYPIWWGQAPKIISTFLETYDFGGKTIVPFCTSGSSGIGSSATNLQSLTDGAGWLSGRRFGGGASSDAVASWVNGLGLDITAD